MRPRLTLNSLDVLRESRTLVKSFSYQFFPGQIIALVGNNGAGKTTFLKTIAGLFDVKPHQIMIDGDDLKSLSPQARAQTISFLLQQTVEQPYCTAKYRIAHGLMPSLGYDFFLDEKTEAQIEETARKLNIHHLLNRRLSQMSGGEQRLVNVAKCLINPSTKILLLDEPTVYLDFTQQHNVLLNILQHAQAQKLVLFSSHDASFIQQSAHGIITIDNGHADVTFKDHEFSSRNFLDNMAAIAASGLSCSYKTR